MAFSWLLGFFVAFQHLFVDFDGLLDALSILIGFGALQGFPGVPQANPRIPSCHFALQAFFFGRGLGVSVWLPTFGVQPSFLF
jgi:hypothetical protein